MLDNLPELPIMVLMVCKIMNTNNIFKMGGLSLAISALAACQASAITTVAYNMGASLAGTQQGGAFTLGDVFTTTSAIQVTGLGAFDPGGAALNNGGISVAIYNISSGVNGASLVGSIVNFSGSVSSLLLPGTSTLMQSVTPFTLGSGTYMIVANNYGVGGSAVNYNPAWDPANGAGPGNPMHAGVNQITANNAPGVTFGTGGYFENSGALGANLDAGWTHDTYWSGGGPNYGAGNFEFTAVPEVENFAMAGMGMLGLVFIGRKVVTRVA